MTIEIDRRIYNDSVISKAIYWLSGDYVIVRSLLNDITESISITTKTGSISEQDLEVKLLQTLNP